MRSLEHIFLSKLNKFDKNSICLIYDDKNYTYGDLLKAIDLQLENLSEIPNSSVVALVSDYSFEFIVNLFTLSLKKCIIAPILPRNIDFSLSEFGIEFVLNSDTITKENSPKSYELLESLKKQNESGLILFSSGSTGKPKAVLHNFDNFFKIYSEKKYNPTRTISLFLPDHIAGIDVVLSVFATGGTLIIPKNRNPQEILQILQDCKVEILPTSPTLLRLLFLSDLHKFDLKNLKLIVHGSEKMDNSLLEKLQSILKHVKFKQSFGTSETNAIKTKNLNDSGFIKLIDTPYKIINNELYLKSKTQSLGYLNADNSAFTKDGYFATGDLVEVLEKDGEEYLKIIARSKEVINIGGEKVLPSEVEGVIAQMPNVLDCVVFGEKNALTGQSVCAKVVLQEHKDTLEFKKELRSFCKDKLANFKIPTKVIIVQSLEITTRFKKVRR